MKKILNYLIVLILVSIGVISFWVYDKYVKVESQKFISFDSKIGTIRETIKARGEVVNEKNYNLDLIYSGIVEDIFVQKGDIVQKGDLLLKLETTDFELELRSLNTLRNQNMAYLDKLEAGSRPEDIKLHSTAVNNAKDNYNNIVISSEEEIQSAILDLEVSEVALENASISLKNSEIGIANAKISLTNIEAVNDTILSGLYENVTIVLQKNLINISSALTRINNILDPNKQLNQKFISVLGTYDEQTLLSAKDDYRRLKDGYDEAKKEMDLLSGTGAVEKIDSMLIRVADLLDLTSVSFTDIYTVLQNTSTNSEFSHDDLINLMSLVASYQLEINQERQFFVSKIEEIKLHNVKSNSDIDNANANIDIAQIKKDELQALYNSAQTQFKSSKQKLIVVETALKTKAQAARGELDFAIDKLSLVKAGAREQDIKIAKAQIEEIDTKIDILNEKINKSSLYSPFHAKVVNILVEKGELFRSSIDRSKSVIGLVSLDYIVQSDISEIDISKIRNGDTDDSVEVVFDAFDNKSYNGKIISIEPREIIKDGDSYYRVNIVIDEAGKGLRSGMNADLKIIISSKDNVLMIPAIAVYDEDDEIFTYILDQDTLNKTGLITGVTDGDYIEILHGVSIGDKVAIPSN